MTNAPWAKPGIIHADAVRITRLGQTGAPVVGAKNAFYSDALVKFSWAPTYTEGQSIERKNGADSPCVVYTGRRKLSGATFKIEVCSPDPELEELLAGGGLLLASNGDVMGYRASAVGADPTPNGVSIECWAKAIVGGAAMAGTPYVRHVFGRGYFSPDERTGENDAMGAAFSGTLDENLNWGNGGFNDWDYSSTRLWQWALDDSLPALTPGYQTVPADAP